jgi:DNA-binding MarR family transcriptional regulator
MANARQVPFETTLHVKDACLCLHTQRAARALARRFDDALRPAGLTNEQFSLMMALNGPKPATLPSVAAILGADRSTLTAALKPLERRGLVVVAIDADDRRRRQVSLTGAGHAALLAALPLWTEAHAALEASLGGDPGGLCHDLDRLAHPHEPTLETVP